MNGETYTVAEPQVRFDGPPWTKPNRTPEEIAEELAWIDRFVEEGKRLDEIEPLPDNFEDICKGAWPPVYSKARAP
jgi:hypothetical protein